MKLISSLLFVAAGTFFTSHVNAAMPKSEILLADFDTPYGMKVSRITDNKSYNNQPFLVDSGLYYTHEVIAETGQSQTDIVFYNFATKTSVNITNTAVSEYSPTLMPNQQALSAIVVEEDGKQKLWQYPLANEQTASRIFEWIEPVGYHAWGAENDLIMFILGEPHTLQYTSIAAAKPRVIAADIGRTLVFDKHTNSYLFSYNKDNQHWVARFAPQTEEVSDLFRLPDSVQDFALIDQNTLAYAVNNRIYKRSLTEPEVVSQWLDLRRFCEGSISRLNYKHNKLAFVCNK
ncbi:hypothetical protein AAEU31_14840 [Pseudoalteromonas sp. SSMSWG5]|jgi:hypothetical protein|uniref:hypothetical protein n=1 Tax=unclassified Pseudoalteromonas TaxID=194690 RepID=UPI000C3EB144|nr:MULTISPECIES: hypothetical protein [unclassified Pseudoalteromonas]MBD55308.1 hypothetical protein [Pseudoalteromonas sp.]MCF2900159.1 hypothetical protein [Pseudoalteromonas sp. OFAV1]TGV19465.1 hypothetical protein E5N72_05035 [Pseudoalteromonas sp. MEBiC 03607]TMO47028.1 hypothetical protein CWC25_01905 [Pseudoalteromonas sp. S4389]|tara:strand:+ start:691 stop:1560 length:870 start_codon:yes stop_codon:yes gene_type:complete